MRNAVFIFIITLLITACKKDEPALFDNSYVPIAGKTFSADEVKCFKQLTINAEFGSGDGTIKKLKDRDVFIYLADTGYAHMSRELDKIIDDINAETGTNLVLRRTTDRVQGIIQVHLTDRQTYIGIEPYTASSFAANPNIPGVCAIQYDQSGNLINHAGPFVDMVRTGNDMILQHYILRHELTHALGFLGHTNIPAFASSIMYNSGSSPRILYSGLDKRLIKLLYNPDVKPGMNDTELNAVLVNL
jgi:Protein of unknown function (DUF2927)